MSYHSIKTYGNDRGFSCCFRQWRATHSHCRFLHGYSLGFRFVFESSSLDERNWVYDFGDLDWLKKWLEEMFDHTTVIAQDDPQLEYFESMQKLGVLDLRVIADVSCEKFAETVYDYSAPEIAKRSKHRVKLVSVEVMEHGSNAARFLPA